MLQARKITIVGTGLLGGSIGLGLRSTGFAGRIIGVGRRRETLARAQALGCIDEGTTDLLAAANASDLVILATPLSAFTAVLKEISPSSSRDLIITDVGSTKTWVCQQARAILSAPLARRFVGSHPMAGKERHGPEAACAGLLRGRPCIMTPEKDTDPAAIAVVESLWRTLEARLVRMTAEDHDDAVATVSHLPHAMAAILVEAANANDRLDIASSGFRDATRIASGDPEVWTDIFITNRAAIAKQLDDLILCLQGFRDRVKEGDAPGIKNVLRSAKAARDQWVQTFEEGEG